MIDLPGGYRRGHSAALRVKGLPLSRRGVVGLTALLVVAVAAVLVLLAVGLAGGRPQAEMTPTSPAPEAPATTVTRIAVAGDTGTGPGSPIEDTVRAMVDQGRHRGYDGLVLLGDLIYPDGDADRTTSRIVDVFAPLTRSGTRLVPVLGNHDYMSDEQSAILAELDRARTWYVDRVGNVRLVVLDTEQVDDLAQAAWLEETLGSPTGAAWTVVAMHKPAYSAGAHGSDEDIQRQWVPLFERYDVPLVLAGHDHDYQRSRPIDGVTYVVSGRSDAPRDRGGGLHRGQHVDPPLRRPARRGRPPDAPRDRPGRDAARLGRALSVTCTQPPAAV